MNAKKCPRGHGDMTLRKVEKNTVFRGVGVSYQSETFVCRVCGLEAGTIKQAAAVQKTIADAFREKKNLLTGKDIRCLRKQKGWTQKALAERLNVGIASIKRWETGLIQSKPMDNALRMHLQGQTPRDAYTGDREFSVERIKRVVSTFERILRKRLLKKTDKLLFAAKYLWYADMVSYRDLGKSMTGATYAALPFGPQLNNYRDLIDEIKAADENSAVALSNEELRIIQKICEKMPTERRVYEAAHSETIWKKTAIGALIPYPLSEKIVSI